MVTVFVIILVLTLAFAIYVYNQLSDESINTWRGVCIITSVILLIVCIILARGSTADLAMCFGLSLLILLVLGIIAEIKCGVKAHGCPNCHRKDSYHETITDKVLIDRAFDYTDNQGYARYTEVIDFYIHGKCDSCGYEYDYVKRRTIRNQRA